MENIDILKKDLEEKAAAVEMIENLEATIESLKGEIEDLQAKHEKIKEETKVPENTREYETMTYQAIKDLRSEIETIKANTEPKRLTQDEILAIPDRSKRLQAIKDNLDLFQKPSQEKEIPANVRLELNRLGITDASLDKMTLDDAQTIKSTPTRLYVIEQLLRRA